MRYVLMRPHFLLNMVEIHSAHARVPRRVNVDFPNWIIEFWMLRPDALV